MGDALLCGWVLLAVACAWIARTKRRDLVGHLLGGLLLGPLWLLVVVALPKAGDPCPSCREPIDPMATACPHCQRPIERRLRRPA